jgi:hypothetical protein
VGLTRSARPTATPIEIRDERQHHAAGSAGERPKGDPAARRSATIGVRVSAREYATLREKAAQLSMAPAQWLREAVLSRRLPSPTGIEKPLVSRVETGLGWSFVSSNTNRNTNRVSPYGLVSASGRPPASQLVRPQVLGRPPFLQR